MRTDMITDLLYHFIRSLCPFFLNVWWFNAILTVFSWVQPVNVNQPVLWLAIEDASFLIKEDEEWSFSFTHSFLSCSQVLFSSRALNLLSSISSKMYENHSNKPSPSVREAMSKHAMMQSMKVMALVSQFSLSHCSNILKSIIDELDDEYPTLSILIPFNSRVCWVEKMLTRSGRAITSPSGSEFVELSLTRELVTETVLGCVYTRWCWRMRWDFMCTHSYLDYLRS